MEEQINPAMLKKLSVMTSIDALFLASYVRVIIKAPPASPVPQKKPTTPIAGQSKAALSCRFKETRDTVIMAKVAIITVLSSTYSKINSAKIEPPRRPNVR